MKGETVIDNDGSSLGVVTSQYTEGAVTYIVISGDYEQSLADFDYVMDLTHGGSYLREKSILRKAII